MCRQKASEGAETLLWVPLQPKCGSHSQVSIQIRFKADDGCGSWAPSTLSDYYGSLNISSGGHRAATQKAGVKEEELTGRMTVETGHAWFHRGHQGSVQQTQVSLSDAIFLFFFLSLFVVGFHVALMYRLEVDQAK